MSIEQARITVLNAMPKQSICAEIGVFKGEFSEKIISIVNPQKLHLIDPWKFEDEPIYSTSRYGGSAGIDQSNMDAMYDSVRKKFSHELAANIVTAHRTPAAEAALSFDDEYFDWVYIDGNHQYEYVKSDLDTYYQKVKQGGLLVCDDYGIEGWWDNGVLKAIHEFLGKYECRVAFVLASQFCIQKIQ